MSFTGRLEDEPAVEEDGDLVQGASYALGVSRVPGRFGGEPDAAATVRVDVAILHARIELPLGVVCPGFALRVVRREPNRNLDAALNSALRSDDQRSLETRRPQSLRDLPAQGWIVFADKATIGAKPARAPNKPWQHGYFSQDGAGTTGRESLDGRFNIVIPASPLRT